MGVSDLASRSYRCRPAAIAAGLLPLLFGGTAQGSDSAADSAAADLAQLSLEELGNIDVTSVSKKSEPLSAAPAAIYVITHDDVVRSGATRVPEMLRLAPNLEVAEATSSSYAISARGFNGTLANKLLVLIDGRSVYTPLYGGVYWDMQDVMAEDVDRIEVISGPGATLWGANAVNGVINITTRKAADTQGGLLSIGFGNLERYAALRYGGKLSDDLAYRVYGKIYGHDDVMTSAGGRSKDRYRLPQGGFRLDWTPADDVVTVQGDLYRSTEGEQAGGDQIVSGHNITARWEHHFSGGSSLQIQAYYDRAQRYDIGGGFKLDTYDIDVQHSFTMGGWNDVVWGGGYRINVDSLRNAAAFGISPPARTLKLGNVFVQDTVTLAPPLKLTLGLKLEDEELAGVEPLPSARLAWKISDTLSVWSAVSRAVRAPTRFDDDVYEKIGTVLFLAGSPSFKPEKVIAYEVGSRVELSRRFSFSVSGFYNDYDNLRSVELSPATFLPLLYSNMMSGHVYGLEAWASYQLTDWWRMSAGFNVQHEHLRFDPGSSGIGGLEQAGNDPDHQVSLKSSMNITDDLTFDADARYVAALPNPAVPAYVEVNGHIAWRVAPFLTMSLTGNNLLHRYHREFNDPTQAVEIARSVMVGTSWSF